jgi:nicotinamidase-related amidase
MPRLRKMKGGYRDAKAEADLNAFYDRYLKEYAGNFPGVVVDGEQTFGGDATNSLIVVDMQNDFTKPHPDGKFSVADGVKMAEPLEKFIKDNMDKFSKVIFTRDNHDPEHCSFQEEGVAETGIFPPHCQINSPGAALYGPFETAFKNNKKVGVVFKGNAPNVDSFGALQYPSDEYGLQRQQGAKCCAPSASAFDKTGTLQEGCAALTGGFYHAKANGEAEFGQTPFEGSTYADIKGQLGAAFQVEDLYGDADKSKAHNVFVVGLAGDYCVRDTARNVAMAAKAKGLNMNVYVIEPFTRYAFVPVSVGGVTEEQYKVITPRKEEANDDGVLVKSGKQLNHYVFTFTEEGNKRILTKEEANRGDFTIDKKGETPKFFHFLTDPRALMETYKSAGVKLLLTVPKLGAAAPAADATAGGGGGFFANLFGGKGQPTQGGGRRRYRRKTARKQKGKGKRRQTRHRS